MNVNLSTFWSGLSAVLLIIAGAVLAGLGKPVPTWYLPVLVGVFVGHFALSSPIASTATGASATPATTAPTVGAASLPAGGASS